jgi:cytochrome c oxidase subunit IV
MPFRPEMQPDRSRTTNVGAECGPRVPASTRIWALLVCLTVLTYSIGERGLEGAPIMLGILAVTLLKAQLVSDYYMGLREVRGWRALISAYLAAVCLLLAAAYLLAST